MTFESVVVAAALLPVAWVAGLALRRRAPEIVAYLLVGAAAGPSAVGVLDAKGLHDLRPVTIAATAFLMVVIGERLTVATFRAAPWIAPAAVGGYLVTAGAVFCAIRAAGGTYVLASVVAALAGGGAPMTVAAIVRREGRHDPYGRSLVALHASCDALVALAFAVVLPVAVAAEGASAGGGGIAAEVARRGVVGALLGIAAGALARALARRGAPAVSGLCTVAAAIAACSALGFSVPLAGLAFGATVAHAPAGAAARAVFVPIRRAEPLLYLVFFVLGGAAIRIGAVPEFAGVGVAYVAARGAAKLLSPLLFAQAAGGVGARLRIGLGSIPHAGVSAALAAAAGAEVPRHGIATVTLGGIVLFELVGAVIVRLQLRGAAAGRGQLSAVTGG